MSDTVQSTDKAEPDVAAIVLEVVFDSEHMDQAAHTKPLSCESEHCGAVVDVLAQIKGAGKQKTAIRTDVKHKLIFFIVIIASCLCAISVFKDSESAKYKVVASATAAICLVFWTYFLYILFKAKRLHQIRLVTTKMKPFTGTSYFRRVSSTEGLTRYFRSASWRPYVGPLCTCRLCGCASQSVPLSRWQSRCTGSMSISMRGTCMTRPSQWSCSSQSAARWHPR